VRDMLRQIRSVATTFAPAPEVAAETGDGEAAPGDAVAAEAGAAGQAGFAANFATAGRPSVNRDDALKTLETIAGFFRKTEPTSPLAYTLDDAIRRARLSWPDLLAEVVPDEAVRLTILTSLGIRLPPQ
jgi:type VI secretion system protein ImpA